ncbi:MULTISPECIES: hypothetical protein [Mycolicibacterium]|uniref:Uncharacterized protein n=2 Tax=Mycolicibacterium gilvum TaxID=1804 RepID=E6TBR4_MYCSR|nr:MULTISPECIES: hypothetical protein [Mycolicibacterium]ADU00776.1 hypothetical protein Mspyr1_42150 [Mycolicibacterium gilvum Spyr1]MBV5246711.1 hypothetical protein [Mycolicibacterium sp. PAM1]MCV7056577.1 hypothetical protein [Mycolicibacterium gilvum]STZ42207.1 Uncharacterised protein [Mycolicibacterium gilvum]
MHTIAVVMTPVVSLATAVAVAAPAAADCTTAGATTICSQGDVRGTNSGTGPVGSSGPYVPYPCDVNYYNCDEWWGVDFDVDLDPGRPGIGGPGGPGGPGIGGPGGPGRPGGGGGGRGGGGRR